jgi:hypothetical protein|tara:strand:- start:613 stop:1365 length:753 start_codon:yes stop_codon:yes gene_type:complete
MKTKNAPQSWEIKDRLYVLKSGIQPLVFTLPSRHTGRKSLLWFDEETGVQKEIRYATNQASPLVEEQKGSATLGHIVFRDGTLQVSKQKQNLQKLLSIYHPAKDVLFKEHDEVELAIDDLEYMNLEIDALIAAKDLDIDVCEAILRVEVGSKVNNMTSKEIKRDLLIFAKRNPALFLDLLQDDNVELRNFGIKAVEAGILKLSPDQRNFTWTSNGRKVLTVPFDEHPYSALASFFKTDEGIEIYKNIEKR